MRFRDITTVLTFAGLTLLAGLCGPALVSHLLYRSNAVNRDDARSVTATELAKDRWVEFQVLHDAINIRLLTNAALKSTDAPDHDLTNPRLGWRYSVDYELLDADRNLLEKSEYHFRTHVRQLVDVSTGKAIYPIFLGKSGLVATQTRPMQLATTGFGGRPAILRVRLQSADPGIQAVVGRSLSRIERQDYDQRYTWTRLSEQRRDLVCKYTVYEPDLLSSTEHTNLLRWRWAQTPTITQSAHRELFFIGDIDDQEVRDEQLPVGLFTDPNWLATIPVPEGQGRVRLEFLPVDVITDAQGEIVVRWFGLGLQHRELHRHKLASESSSLEFDADGGLIQIEAPVRVVIRAYWSAHDPVTEGEGGEIEVTPTPRLIKTFVADEQPIEYSIGHLSNEPTPLRLSLRYPFGPHFGNPAISSADDPRINALPPVTTRWEFLGGGGELVEAGEIHFQPVASRYEFLELIGGMEWLSESLDRYFAVPPGVERLRLTVLGGRLLVNASVRPPGVSRETRIPEDYHAYHARDSLNRTWFAINPPDANQRVQANRSFIIRSHTRPPEDNEDVLAGNYEWQSFRPQGQWIGRQILVPRETDLEVRDSAIATTFFELLPDTNYDFSSFDVAISSPPRLLVIAAEAPGRISLQVNQQTLLTKQIESARSEIDLANLTLPGQGTLSISAANTARFFIAGLNLPAAQRFLKRTAQRLRGGKLEFNYEKLTSEDELLTIQVYRGRTDEDRCRLSVNIQSPRSNANLDANPLEYWTIRNRIYDLRPHPGQPSVLVGKAEPVDVGHRCFVRLGKDLHPGEYQITVQRMDQGGEGYVVLYETLPGIRQLRKLRIGSIDNDPHEP